MAQQQREENSVLFSLKELRRLEDDRQRQEDDERRASVEAERRAREDAERRVREEAERRVRDEEARVRKIEEDRVAREREEQMRLAEAERRARVEGEMRLQEQRMRLEVHAQKAKSPVKPIVGAIAIVVVLAGGLALKLTSDAKAAKEQATLLAQQAKEEADRNIARANQQAADAKRQAEAAEKQYQTLLKQMQDELSNARTKADRDAIQSRIDNLKKRGGKHSGTAAVAPTTPSSNPGIRIRDISDDPTAGLPR
jgi:hypothetical protein